ncbi:helix-turn-helix domain-containing protein [Gilvimarinus sp. F26214L]
MSNSRMLAKNWDKSYEVLRTELKAIRIGAGLRQQDLGARLGVPQSFVSKYERGERKLTFVEVLLVCDACQYDPGELVRQILPYVQR